MSVSTMVILSKMVYCRRADMIPTGMPTAIANSRAANDRMKVFGRRDITCSMTLRSFL